MARVVLVAPYSRFYVHFRWDFMKRLVQAGHEVIAIGPYNDCDCDFESIGVQYKVIPLKNTGINPLYDTYTIYYLIKLLKRIKPDIVACFAIKPVLYGSFAARLANVNQVYLTITGLGYVFIGTSLRKRILLSFVKCLYKLALGISKKVFFENRDDLFLFTSSKLLKEEKKGVIINGSGVNLESFPFVSYKSGPLTFLLVARLIKDKGIEEFVEASRILKSKYPKISCKIVGPFDENPTVISKAKVTQWVSEGVIEYLGETNDVRPYLAEASVFVLPSYREGTSKAVLEAMAMGLPVITTDAPGCRETVLTNVNGFLVPVKSVEALAEAMEKFVLNPGLVKMMGAESRELAVQKYDVQKVNNVILENMNLA